MSSQYGREGGGGGTWRTRSRQRGASRSASPICAGTAHLASAGTVVGCVGGREEGPLTSAGTVVGCVGGREEGPLASAGTVGGCVGGREEGRGGGTSAQSNGPSREKAFSGAARSSCSVPRGLFAACSPGAGDVRTRAAG